MARLIQSTREILDIHNNLLFQMEKINSTDIPSFLSLFSLFISLLSPYVYYASIVTLCCTYLTESSLHQPLTSSKTADPVFAHFFQSYASLHKAEHKSFQLFDVLTIPIKRVGNGVVTEE